MVQVMLAVDTILEAIIGHNPDRINNLLEEARNGKVELLILHDALCCALYSVRQEDHIFIRRLAELLNYSQIQVPEYLGVGERSDWIPKLDEIDHWRSVVLAKDA